MARCLLPIMPPSLRRPAVLRTVLTASLTQPKQHHRCLSNLSSSLASASCISRAFPMPGTRSPGFSRLPSAPTRHHSTLPVLQHHIPRTYPFPLILTTELLVEEDVELHRSNPHDLPPYKSSLTCNIHDLPLTAAEKRVFRLLVGARMYSHTFHPHPVPSFLTAKQTVHMPKHRRQRAKDSAVRVRFVSRHLGSAAANENRVFQLLDECIRTSKVLVAEMAADGQWVEEGEDETIIREATRRLRGGGPGREETGQDGNERDEERASAAGGQQAQMRESVGRVAEKQRVPAEGAAGEKRH